MRNALSMPAGACSETNVAKKLLISRLKLISPRLIVTGSISSSTCRTSGEILRGSSQIILKLKLVLRRSHIGIASWITVPTSTPMAYA